MADGAGSPPPKTLEQLEAEHRPPPAGVLLHQHGPEATEQNPLRNYVRDLTLGFNDGLVSVFAVVAGVAAAVGDARTVLLGGIAATVAGALSMGIGEYLSTKSQAEYYDAERRLEREHIRDYPELEKQEMREYLAAKGIEGEALEQVLAKLQSDPEKFLDVMMLEEFGQGPQSDRSPLYASGIIMVAFVVGAALPVLPFALVPAEAPLRGLAVATALSVVGLAAAGALKAWVSGLNQWKSAAEMVALGVAAAAITYGVGALVGVNL